MLRAAVPVIFCVLVFLFALHAKTAVYGGAHQARVTPSTASKMWAGGEKLDFRAVVPQSAPPAWLMFVSLLGLYLFPEQRSYQNALVAPLPNNLRLRYLHRFLRPPPFQS